MENDLLYRLALTRVQGIGPSRTRLLIGQFGEAAAIFRADAETLARIKGIGSARARAIREFRGFSALEKELAFLERYQVRALFFTDPAYPRRLEKNRQAPAMLFYKGVADLNAAKILSVVGTRNPTDHGKQWTDHIIAALASSGLLIVSGLAFGIDAAAHKSALRHRLPTVGVLGHGLDRIYPAQHARLAGEMAGTGGLLTGFGMGTRPDAQHFPIRNRIVAGMSDALLVVETTCRGGSTLTVGNALAYDKKVFAIPGRINDLKSAGCNALIREGKAILFTGPEQLLQELDWSGPPAGGETLTGRATLAGRESTGTKPAASSGTEDSPLRRPFPFRPLPQGSARQAKGGSTCPRPTRPGRAQPLAVSLRHGSKPSETAISTKEKVLLDLLRQTGGLSLDQLLAKQSGDARELSLALLNLELEGFIRCAAGSGYTAM